MTVPTPFITIPGTHSWVPGRTTGEWYHADSPWSDYMKSQGFLQVECDGRPFEWSTSIDGILPWRKGVDWAAAGGNFFAWVVPPLAPDHRVPPDLTNVITHSHGLQPLLYACARGLKVNSLTDIAGPVRKDMMDVAKFARPNIRYWQHVHSDRSDKMQWLGEFGDGALGIVRAHPLADSNVSVPKAGHSGLLTDPQWFMLWPELLGNIRALRVSSKASKVRDLAESRGMDT